MHVAWNEDDPQDLPAIEANLRDLLRELVQDTAQRRLPTVRMAQEWHRNIYRGCSLPVPYYAGEIRDRDPRFPQLIGYEVVIGDSPGVPSRDVPDQLTRFESALQNAVARLDMVISSGEFPADSQILFSVLTLCAQAHGEWVRIHPFANGNGRTARVWAVWCALRYSLPPFIRLKPRPNDSGYGIAARESMQGNHHGMTAVFADMLERHLRG